MNPGLPEKYKEKINQKRLIKCKSCGNLMASKMRIPRCGKCGAYTEEY